MTEETIDDVKQAYALLFKDHGAVVKERDELASRVRELEGLFSLVHTDCQNLHHAKKDQHLLSEPCLVEGRIRAALNASKEQP